MKIVVSKIWIILNEKKQFTEVLLHYFVAQVGIWGSFPFSAHFNLISTSIIRLLIT